MLVYIKTPQHLVILINSVSILFYFWADLKISAGWNTNFIYSSPPQVITKNKGQFCYFLKLIVLKMLFCRTWIEDKYSGDLLRQNCSNGCHSDTAMKRPRSSHFGFSTYEMFIFYPVSATVSASALYLLQRNILNVQHEFKSCCEFHKSQVSECLVPKVFMEISGFLQ